MKLWIVKRLLSLANALILSALISCFVPVANAQSTASAQEQVSGFAFQDFDFETTPSAAMQGDWWFHFGAHLSPVDALRAAQESTLDTISVPSDWRATYADDFRNPYANGRATYLTRVTLPDINHNHLLLVLPRVADAYAVYWIPADDPDHWHKLGENGTLTGPLVPSHDMRAFSLMDARDGYLMLHVRKELQSYGGILRTPYVSVSGAYQNGLQVRRIADGMVMGITIFVSVFNLFLFLLYRKDPATLLLSIGGFALFVRAMIMTGTLETMLGMEARSVLTRFEYAGVLLIAWTSYAMHQSLLWRSFSQLKGPAIVGMIGMLGAAFLFAAPLPQVTENLRYVQLYCVLTFALVLVTSTRAIQTGQPQAWFYTIGWCLPLLAGLNDIYTSKTNGTLYLSNPAFVLFISVYSWKVGRRVTTEINRAEFLLQERKNLEELHQNALISARHDHLTGLLNRYAFDDELSLEWHEKDCSEAGLSLVILEIEELAHINAAHDHKMGDAVLRSVAELLSHSLLRKTDRICRYTGNSFVFLLSDTDTTTAWRVAERVQHRLKMHEVVSDDGERLLIKASFGIATAAPNTDGPSYVLIQKAEQALAHARAAGGSTIARFEDLADEQNPFTRRISDRAEPLNDQLQNQPLPKAS